MSSIHELLKIIADTEDKLDIGNCQLLNMFKRADEYRATIIEQADRIKYLESMIENGLGFKDMERDL